MDYGRHIEWEAYHHPAEYPTDPAAERRQRTLDAVADWERGFGPQDVHPHHDAEGWD